MLSNKLTFSLALVVMLAFGSMLMATPVEAGQYDASWSSPNWTVNIYFPVADDPVEVSTAAGAIGIVPTTPKVAADTDDTDDGLSGIAATNVTVASSAVTVTVLQAIPAAGAADSVATTLSNAKFVRYAVNLAQATSDTTPDDGVDQGAVTFTVEGYGSVNLATDDQTDGITLQMLPALAVDAPANTIEFTLDPNVSRFKVIYNSAADENATDEVLDNGIRIGANYVDSEATFAADNLPDLAAFFAQGGSITLGGSQGIFITEIMWGHDAMDGTGMPSADNQWIEVYYSGAFDDATDPLELQLQFVYNQVDRSGVDEISNIYLARWNPKGQSGRSGFSAVDGSAPIPVVSMYRNRGLTTTGDYVDAKFGNGVHDNQWSASQASKNMSGFFTGTPGAPHLPPTVGGGNLDYGKTEVPGTPLQFSEIRNDGSADNVDWIEIRNVSDAAVNLKDYEISMVTGVSRSDLYAERGYHATDPRREAKEHEKAIVGHDDYNNDGQNDVKRFPDWMLPAGSYLLIVNRDPSETNLASGKNIEVLANPNIDDKTTNHGAGFYYFVTPHLKLGGLMVMRRGVDRNEFHGNVRDSKIVDLAGSGRFADNTERARYNFNTEVWPLRGWRNPGGSPNVGSTGVWNFVKDGNHEWWKTDGVGANNKGIGYDKGVDLRYALGTPGYPNGVLKEKIADLSAGSEISISEIMFDASLHAGNERWNLVQWIELYNSSMSEAINLNGWELEIRNSDSHVDSFVDSSFTFGELIIHPNQTVLLVSARADNKGISDRQVYNLYTNHARELGLTNRRSNLLSPEGFYLKLIDKDKATVDEVGNVDISDPRNRVTNDWAAMPPSEGEVRYSLVRQYGTREQDGNGPDAAAVGTMEEAWILADLGGGFVGSYYGQQGDVATPGFRTGGPLPVSLSSFRPARDKATGEVVIRWITQSELNNAGFNILRSETKNGEFKVVNLKGLIPGHGTTSEKHVYEWKDTTAKPNVVYYYQIEDVSFEGQHTTLATTHLRGNVNAAGKVTTTWGDLKTQ